jgi:membrane-associated phospholipid phosphatase
VIVLDFDKVNWHSWSPGLLEQDLITMPMELALIGVINEVYTPTPKSLYPFKNEVSPLQRNRSRHPKELLAPIGAGWALGTLGFLEATTDRFPLAPVFRGWIHAHLVTEILTTTAKVSFQRPRPFYGREQASGNRIREDDRFSFFSGHASHAFAFAGYSSSAILHRTQYAPGAFVYAAGAFTLASVVSRARAVDGQHNWSDIVAGGAVGLATSILTYRRVEQVIEENNLTPPQCEGDECQRWSLRAMLSPILYKMDKRDLIGINLNLNF